MAVPALRHSIIRHVQQRFDDMTIDAETRQLWRGGREVHLSPKAFDLLALLVARRPAAVSKIAIRELLWPDTFVSETNLPALVAEIRAEDEDGGTVKPGTAAGLSFCSLRPG